MVTVEAAIAIGSLVAVLAVVLAAVGAVIAQIRCVDAAGEAARRASRDDTTGAQALARDLPVGTEVRVDPEGDLVHVVVRVPPLGGALPGLRLTAEAVAAREPAVAAPTGGTDDGAADGPEMAPDVPGPTTLPVPGSATLPVPGPTTPGRARTVEAGRVRPRGGTAVSADHRHRTGLRDDRGLATVVAAGVIGVVGLLLGALLVLGAVVATRHRAENAADLAALAGAAESVRGREPACARARVVAERNGAALVDCTFLGWDLQVDVARSCGCLPTADTTTVRARAGPVVKVMR